MNDADKKELAIWAGAPLLVVLGCWYLASGWAAERAGYDAAIARAEGDYQRLFLGSGERVSQEQAVAGLEAARAAQEAELKDLRRLKTVQIPRPYFEQVNQSIVSTVARAKDVHTRLRKRAERMDLAAFPTLPYEADSSLDRDSPTIRSRQLVDIWFYEKVLDFLMNQEPRAIELFALEGLGKGAGYAIFRSSARIEISREQLDRMLAILRGERPPFNLRHLELVPATGDGFSVTIGLDLIAGWPSEWGDDQLQRGNLQSRANGTSGGGGRRR